MIIDAHQHFWKYTEVEYRWIGKDMEYLKKDFLPHDLEPILQSLDIEGTITVQARQTLNETSWLLKLSDQHSFIKGIVGWVDLCGEKVYEQLKEFCRYPKLVGVRHALQDEPDEQFMLRENFINGLKILGDFGLTFDLLIEAHHLPVACELVSLFPNQLFILNHMARPHIRERQIEPWRTYIRQLASFPNLACKITALVTQADWALWNFDDFKPYLDIVFEAFGTDRIIFGSRWPVCTLAANYKAVLDIILHYIQAFSEEQKAAILGKNALRFYNLNENDD